MGVLGGELGYRILKFFRPRESTRAPDDSGDHQHSDLDQHFGRQAIDSLVGRRVIDFGCGFGRETVALAKRGAARVIGLDIEDFKLSAARQFADLAGMSDRCTFARSTDEKADVILSKDAFEHFGDPAAILDIMARLLAPGGHVLASFGPTWLHPYGGHLFSVFPWSHLMFTEAAQIRWRSQFRADGARRFSEVEGGLNQITIAKFCDIVHRSAFQFESLDLVPIRGLKILKHRPFREFGTSFVRCRLSLKPQSPR